MTSILGISALYHDAAAAVVIDGKIVAAAQQERFSREKHDAGIPADAIAYCLREANLSPADLDFVGFYDKPLLKFDRILETCHAVAPRGFAAFAASIPAWLRQKLHVPKELRRALGGGYRKRFVFAEHHESHAASAFFPSPFEEAAILTVDGVGEWATAALGTGSGNTIRLSHELRFPDSLGLLYAAATYHCGFAVNSDEYKVMGLAPYGEPRFAGPILREVMDLKEDGSFRLDMSFFDYCGGLRMTSRKFADRFGGPPRAPGTPLSQRDMDLAASVQRVVEEVLTRTIRHLHASTGMKNLCMAGGVALNCVANGRILREGPFERMWIQPAADDAGGALGVALLVWHALLGKPRSPAAGDGISGSLLGPRFSDDEIEVCLRDAGLPYRRFDREDDLVREAVGILAAGKVLGWFQGRMEFGPRALGSRSILADPRTARMRSLINRKIKFREMFRPFAAAVLENEVGTYFDLAPADAGPYMIVVARVRSGRGAAAIPAVTHVDGTCRVQTVDAERNPRFHRLLEAFADRTGCPVLVNTSFNVKGEPIVCTPGDAIRCFAASSLDALAIGNLLLLREDAT